MASCAVLDASEGDDAPLGPDDGGWDAMALVRD